MHFEITMSSDGQSLDPFNSAIFFISNISAISTSFVPSSTTTSSISASSSASSQLPTLSSTSTTRTISSSTLTSAAASATSAASKDTNTSNTTQKLGLGIGLGLGLPFILLISGSMGFVTSRRKKAAASATEEDKYYVSPSAREYKSVLQKAQFHEADRESAIHEAPTDVAHEASGSDGQFEMSADRYVR
jgi:hypothetical protein